MLRTTVRAATLGMPPQEFPYRLLEPFRRFIEPSLPSPERHLVYAEKRRHVHLSKF
jgi:hypothetical protein